MLRVGLTGGIGCGKSTVARLFAAHGVPVIDADELARRVVEPGAAGLAAIVEAFGPDVLDASGALDRGRLRERVFKDSDSHQRLEALLHPLIREAMELKAESTEAPYVLLVIPLLVEKGWGEMVDRVLVVDCPESEQVRRTLDRDGVSEQQVRAIMGHQVSRTERLAAADDVIANSGPPEALEAQIRQLHDRYLKMV